MKKLLIISICFVSQPILAGGDYFPVKVISIESSSTEFSLVARPIVEEKAWMDKECREIAVVGNFDRLRWARYKSPMSKETHLNSIEALKEAMKNKTNINFGYMGNGLKELRNCNYKSKGLFGGNQTVFSVHDRI